MRPVMSQDLKLSERGARLGVLWNMLPTEQQDRWSTEASTLNWEQYNKMAGADDVKAEIRRKLTAA